MIDPLERWADFGEKPDYAGLASFAGLPYSEDPADLEGVDAAVIGAPVDELTSGRPGTRLGPRAIRNASSFSGPQLETGIDALREDLRVIDFGDAPVLPADPVRSHQAIEHAVGLIVAAGALPVVLGGDHSIAGPDARACAAVHGPVGLVHFDTHTDTGREVFGAALSHGSPMYWLVEDGHVDPARYVQIGLRGYWPGPEELEWQRGHGIGSHPMHEIRDRGLRPVIADAIEAVGDGPVFLSVDVDVLDPAFAPGTGTPEPGGLTSAELLWACREVTSRLDLVGADVVEVLPDRVGSRDITALVAERVVREILTGVVLRRRAQAPLARSLGATYP